MQAHSADLRSEIEDEALVATLAQDYHAAALDAATRAVLDYAVKLTRTPAACCEEDIAALRAHGFADDAIVDLVQVVAYFNYINRVADGLGVTPEAEAE